MQARNGSGRTKRMRRRIRHTAVALLFIVLVTWSIQGTMAQPPEAPEEPSEWWDPPKDEQEPDVSIKWNGSSGKVGEGCRIKFTFKVTDQGPLFYHSGVNLSTFQVTFRGKTYAGAGMKVTRNWLTIESPLTKKYTVSEYYIRWAHTMRPVSSTCRKLLQISVKDEAGNRASVSRYVTILNTQTGDGSAGESQDDADANWYDGLMKEGNWYVVRVRMVAGEGQWRAADQWSFNTNQEKLQATEFNSWKWHELASCIYYAWYSATPEGKDPEIYYPGRWLQTQDGLSGFITMLEYDKQYAGGDFGGFYAAGGPGPPGKAFPGAD